MSASITELQAVQEQLAAVLVRMAALEASTGRFLQAEPEVVLSTQYNEPLDNVWMLLTGYLVWFMSAGFCFLEMGSVRTKNSNNILAKNMIVPVLAFLCWWVSGYALAFGSVIDKPNKFIGGTYFFLYGFGDNPALYRQWFFQGAFCDTSASIVSGGIAERMTLLGYVVHTLFMTAFIYPVGVYWAWSGAGWMNYLDSNGNQVSTVGPWYKDWAGSGVIHFVGGVAALVGAIAVGPRKDRFNPDVNEDEFRPHSIPFTVLGTFILWLGWYGFNPGCTLSMHDAAAAYRSAITAVNTTLAPCAAGVVAFLLRKYVMPPYHFDVPALCNGVLAGLVAVTAPSGFVKHWEAIIIGAIGGVLYCVGAWTFPKLKIDDPIDALSVHLVNGAWGALAVGFFGNPKEGLQGNGVFYGGNQLGIQALALLVYFAWSGVLSLAIFAPLRLLGLLRWSDEIQDFGADLAQHSPPKEYEAKRESARSGSGATPASPAGKQETTV